MAGRNGATDGRRPYYREGQRAATESALDQGREVHGDRNGRNRSSGPRPVFRVAMTGSRLTRRTLLAAMAGSGALAATPTAPARAAPRAPGAERGPRVFALPLGDLNAGVRRVRAPAPFELVGVHWAAPASARLSLRTIGAAGAPGAWAGAAASGHGPDRVASGAPRTGDPLWTGRAQDLELRVDAPMRDVVLHFVAASPSPAPAAQAAALALAQPTLQAGPGQPPIIAREAWAQGMAPAPSSGAGYGAVRLAFVHHTENPNGYSSADVPAMLRAIWAYHVYSNGWHDIGYNFVIDAFGRTFEARAGGIDEPVVGAQAGGYNLVSTGVAILGAFQTALPSASALTALTHLLGWKLSLHGVPTTGQVAVHVDPAGAVYSRFPAGAAVELPRIAGHRDGDTTDCPGDALYAQLPALRGRARVLAAQPLVTTLAAGATTLTAPGPAILTGTLTALDGAPVPGAAVALQSRTIAGPAGAPLETTIAQLSTDPDGRFAVSLPVSFNASLRVLFAGATGLPATVSAPLDLAVAPALTLTTPVPAVAVGAPVTLTGTVSPPVARVLVIVSGPPSGAGRAAVSTHHLPVSGGAFALTFNPSRPGPYRCIARTPADVHRAAGASAPLTLTAA